MSTPTAHRETRSLVTSLARAGWGELGGASMQGCRSVLVALVNSLPWQAGAGLVTVSQVADRAGLSERWVRTRMHLLEDLGVIEWTRGAVVDGRPTPSWVRIVKTMLVQLIELARPALDAITAGRRAATLARIQGLKRLYVRPRKRNPLPVHAELSTYPHPLTGESPTGDDSPPVDNTHESRSPMYAICEHHEIANRCPICVPAGRPPKGFEYADKCEGCGRTRAMHDQVAHRTGDPHPWVPVTLRLWWA